jgi:hypothetical protein
VDYAGGVGAEKAGKGRRILNDALGVNPGDKMASGIGQVV